MISKHKPVILWSTQGGRAKACARRTGRIFRDVTLSISSSAGEDSSANQGLYCGCSFDDYGANEFLSLGRGLNGVGDSHGDGDQEEDDDSVIMFLFVSTTGDAEHCDSIRETWSILLQKSLPSTQFSNVKFALFCLGDRAYGPTAFCAAGRKLATRLVQLGATPLCNIGYGDDGTPNGGVFCDLDEWIQSEFLPCLLGDGHRDTSSPRNRKLHIPTSSVPILKSPYEVAFDGGRTKTTEHLDTASNEPPTHEWQAPPYRLAYDRFFTSLCPHTAYEYCAEHGTRIATPSSTATTHKRTSLAPLIASIQTNQRLTSKDWNQNTRHLTLHVKTTPAKLDFSKSQIGLKAASAIESKESSLPVSESDHSPPLPYGAGDIATIMPMNSKKTVQQFLSCLPHSISSKADIPLQITTQMTQSTQYSSSFIPWPKACTLRGILTYCADISSYPEREDLRSLSVYCHPNHPMGLDQRDKLISLSETSDAALYGDYIIREKRNWADLLFDFESIRYEDTNGLTTTQGALNDFVPLTIEHLLMILPSIMPRHFSIASAPSTAIINGKEYGYSKTMGSKGFELDLCVAIVEGKTPHGRQYRGLCSYYLSTLKEHHQSLVRLWVRPGSFTKVPFSFCSSDKGSAVQYDTPVMCIGAGTGVAPLRSILREREAVRTLHEKKDAKLLNESKMQDTIDNFLVFGCRKSSADYYYKSEWESYKHRLRVLTAFSRDQKHKVYVQHVVRDADDGLLTAAHILQNNGAIYIAGGAKMARNVRDEIIECLGKHLPGGEKDAKLLVKKLQQRGKFNVEAWS